MKVKYYDLENKRVFITGGGSGIGASIVEHFCEQGSEVYFIDIDIKSISENEVLSAIDSLEIRIEDLIKEKDQMYLENQSLKDENSELIQDYKEMKQKNSLAKNKAKMILDRLNEIENSA